MFRKVLSETSNNVYDYTGKRMTVTVFILSMFLHHTLKQTPYVGICSKFFSLEESIS